jgi:hypothetical protein
MRVKLMEGLKKLEAFTTPDLDLLAEYVDYLEGVARDYHMHAQLIARATGGTVPERGVWEPDK